jgi:hypothetical protein
LFCKKLKKQRKPSRGLLAHRLNGDSPQRTCANFGWSVVPTGDAFCDDAGKVIIWINDAPICLPLAILCRERCIGLPLCNANAREALAKRLGLLLVSPERQDKSLPGCHMPFKCGQYAGTIGRGRRPLECAMPQRKRFRPSNPPPSGKRRCPKCGLPMFLSKIEPVEKEGRDERTFECAQCAYGERVIVKFR